MTTKPTCQRCGAAPAYTGARFCGAACCALWEAGDPGGRGSSPWLNRSDRIGFAVWCIFLALLVAMVFILTPGCSFPAEGTGLVGCDGCYRPPHPDGVHLPQHTDEGTSTPTDSDESDESESTAEPSSEAESSSTPLDSDSSSESPPEESSDTGQDSGEPEPFEPAHCDGFDDEIECPDDAYQAVEPDGLNSCYCATSCASDDDCGPHEWCDPFFAACTVWCDSEEDCYTLDVTLHCSQWWLAADNWTRACAYPNEGP